MQIFLDLLKIDYDHSFYKDLNKDYKNLLFKDYSVYLSEMMLLKIDRTSMANSLEVRSPFVDHELVEYIDVPGAHCTLPTTG